MIHLAKTARCESDRPCYRRALDLAHAAVDIDFDARDVGGVGGCEESDGAGDFFWPANALHRYVGHKMLHHGVCVFLGHTEASEDWSFDGAGSNRVDANVACDEFRSQRAREGSQSGFGSGIDGCRGIAFDSSDAGVQDDRAAIVEVWKGLLNAVVSALGVDIENFVVMGFVSVFDWLKFGDSRVDKEDVDLAEFLRDRRVEAIEIGEFGDVGFHCENVVAEELDGFIESFLAAAGNRDLGAFVKKALGGGETDAAIAASDDGDLTCKAFHKFLLGCCAVAVLGN
jgi:hypothetical protein